MERALELWIRGPLTIMSSQFTITSALTLDYDDKKYKQELIKQRQEAKERLCEEEKQQ